MDPMTAPISKLSSWMSSIMETESQTGKSSSASFTANFHPINNSVNVSRAIKTVEQCERFVNYEDIRSENFLSAPSSDVSTSEEESDVSLPYATVSPSVFPLSSSYRSYYSPSGYATSPTYIRGDFYHLTPPGPVTLQTDEEDMEEIEKSSPRSPQYKTELYSKKPHPFSIDAILSSDSSGQRSFQPETPAQVTSALSQSYVAALNQNLGASTRRSGCEQIVYWCHVCRDLLSSDVEVAMHQTIHRADGATCDLRRMLFQRHGYVTEHVDTGFLSRMKCGLCHKIVAGCFFSKHMRIHDGHVCHFCDHEFATNSRLRDHMNVHKGVKPFDCSMCDKKFVRKSSLSQHMRYHRDFQVYKCSYCLKSFNSKYACSVHERIHTGNNPFKCHVTGCSKAFPQKIQLQLHLNSHTKRGGC